MDILYLVFAFICGFGFSLAGLPTLIGFLAAGFILNFMGVGFNENLQTLADLGITLMLFTVGLKINIKDLIKPATWASSSIHMAVWMAIGSVLISLLSIGLLQAFSNLDLNQTALIVFALSFSSTVCVVKILEESGELKTRHGKIAIGVLIMQDVIAVLFLVFATGKIPSIWALALFGLLAVRPLFGLVLARAGHGELLPLIGFLFALGSYELFDLVGVKGDVGALLMGMLLAPHAKAGELAKSLLSFKDLFLIGFFLTVGFTAIPTLNMVGTALLLCLLLPLKFVLFYGIFVLLKLRARTAYLASLVLSNFSEFGLIVMALLVKQEWLDKSWLVVVAISVSVSFVITGVLYQRSHAQYKRFKRFLKRFESNKRLQEDVYPCLSHASILVIGLGRVGKGAFTALTHAAGDQVWGMDADRNRINKLQNEGWQVIVGDGEDIDLWENLNIKDVKLVLIALPSIEDTKNISEQLKGAGYTGKIAAIARYEDESRELIAAGTDKVFNYFTEAGIGFAEESLQLIEAR